MWPKWLDKAASAVVNVVAHPVDSIKAAGTWVYDNAGTISTVLSVAALACTVIPPLQAAAPFLGAAAAVFGAIDTAKSCIEGAALDCAVGIASMVPGGRALGAAEKGLAKGAKYADEAVEGAEDAAKAARNAEHAGIPTSCKLSFDPATPVLMADGSTKPIASVDLGDWVLATDPETGLSLARPVVALFAHEDTDLADVTIVGADGRPATVHATQNHPFWDVTTGQWTLAADLKPGHQLLTAEGSTASIIAVHAWTERKLMFNIGIGEIHSYYVIIGGTPVLVHNRLPEEDVGTHGSLRPATSGYQINHIPPHSTYKDLYPGTTYAKGPAIRMEYADHRALYSTDRGYESQAWRQWQKELIAQGRVSEAMQMDYDDIERRFPGKYSAQIDLHKQMYGDGAWLDPGCP
jgi:hypothetical protein